MSRSRTPRKVNSDMVRLAREFRRLTQTALAERLRITQAAISQIESGVQKDVSDELLTALSKELKFPESFFFAETHMTSIGSSALYYRKRQKLSAGDLRWAQALINVLRIHLDRLLQSVNLNTRLPLPQYDMDDLGSASSGARKLRQTWKLPTGPVTDLTDLVERAGVFVIPCDFGTRHLDGTSLWLAECAPIIFINKDLPADRYRWTLAHELGHLVLHPEPRDTQESEADEFASELLMPHSDIRPYFRQRLSMQAFATMKHYWKVSMAALVRRARDLNAINEHQYRYYNMHLRKQGFPEPYQFQKESPKAWKELLEFYRDELQYTKQDIVAMLQCGESDFDELYAVFHDGKPRLRLVN